MQKRISVAILALGVCFAAVQPLHASTPGKTRPARIERRMEGRPGIVGWLMEQLRSTPQKGKGSSSAQYKLLGGDPPPAPNDPEDEGEGRTHQPIGG